MRFVEKNSRPKVAVVIPCYKVRAHILEVLKAIPSICSQIFVVDDACPENSGDWVVAKQKDKRVKVLFHKQNQGVGGATLTGYQAAIDAGADIIVKLDGDGQMDPQLIPDLIDPIERGIADYAKGNRFHHIRFLASMPFARALGNAAASFVTKVSTGYWHIFDPTNGFTACSSAVLQEIALDRVERRYFFESDLLYHLSTVRAVVVDVPMEAKYADEVSNLSIPRVAPEMAWKHIRNTFRRIFYSYFIRDFNLASLLLLGSVPLLSFGVSWGSYQWWLSIETGHPATSGTVMLVSLPIILGVQFLLSFINYDISSSPRVRRSQLTRQLRPKKRDAA